MMRTVRSRVSTTISIVLIAAGFCVFSYRWYTGSPIANTIETVHVGGGSSIAIRNLTGYCNDIDPDVISSLERAASNGKIIAVSAPCPDLAALKSGRVAGLRKYIVWFVGSTDSGSPLKLPADTTQSDFANEIANTTAKVDFAEVASDVAKNGLKVESFAKDSLTAKSTLSTWEVFLRETMVEPLRSSHASRASQPFTISL